MGFDEGVQLVSYWILTSRKPHRATSHTENCFTPVKHKSQHHKQKPGAQSRTKRDQVKNGQ